MKKVKESKSKGKGSGVYYAPLQREIWCQARTGLKLSALISQTFHTLDGEVLSKCEFEVHLKEYESVPPL
jgi:hypothetical protein